MSNSKRLEFDLIINDLVNYASLGLNKEKIRNLSLINDRDILENELTKTDEASRILLRHGRIIIEELNNIYKSIDKASKGGVLLIDELYDIKRLLVIIRENKNFSQNIDSTEFKFFFSYINTFNYCKELHDSLIKTITDTKEVHDHASSKLHKIRKEIKKLEGEIEEKLLKIISTHSSILSDTNIVYKNNKQVLAVQSMHKYKLGGVIVEESNSGYTSYVEPEVVYKITSQINILKNEENEEIYRILKELSTMVAFSSEELNNNFTNILELDFMFAKGEYCNNIDGKIAHINDEKIELIKARHPLIDKDNVISNDFYLDKNEGKVLIISGPNTGGKSVALKTVGLLSYMNQCGLAIPVKKATLPLFDDIYVDIGDNQSIISSLSTFSSHISNISHILKNLTSKSLVLLDEIGAGTDPRDGESLAMAIIDYCHQKDCFLLSSTHYDNLKTFSLNQNYIQVSSMEFDKVNLKPTYHLLKNQIGKSYALEISSRYGISQDIIKKAHNYKEEYSTSTEKTLQQLEIELEKQKQIIDEYNLKNNELENLIKENLEIKNNLNNEIRKIKETADQEVQKLVKDTKEEINFILQEIKEKENLKMHEALIANKKLDSLIEESEETKENKEFKINDLVKIISLNRKGTIVSVNKNKYGVNVGNMTINVESNDLEKAKNNISKKQNKVVISNGVKSSKMSMELNLIGKRVEEALIELDAFIDRAKLMNLPLVRIIHGYGTGRLQKAVHEYLKNVKNIEYHFGGEFDGGMGSTLVEFIKK